MHTKHITACLDYILRCSDNYIRKDNICRFGLTSKSHPGLNIMAMTESMAREIYKKDYLDPYNYHHIADSRLAAKLADTSVWLGTSRAVYKLQLAMANMTPCPLDGKLGPSTIRILNSLTTDVVMSLFILELRAMAIKNGSYADMENRIERVP